MKKHILIFASIIAIVGCDQKPTQPADKAKAEAAKPEAAKPEAAKPEAAKPEAAKPEAAKAQATTKANPAEAAKKAASALAAPSKTGGLPAPADVAAAPADAEKTASGLASKIIKKGTGNQKPKSTDTVKVHYTGWTTDGKMFDSSIMRGEPASFALNQVIKGWTEGVALMVVGEKRRFWIPGNLAYGDTPSRPGAPAGTLVFDVELLEIEKPVSPEEAKKQFDAFAKHVAEGATKICGCKDMACAMMNIMEMRKVPPPKGQPTKEQLAVLMPHMQKLDGCVKKLQAAAQPAAIPGAPGGATAPKPAPAPAGKK